MSDFMGKHFFANVLTISETLKLDFWKFAQFLVFKISPNNTNLSIFQNDMINYIVLELISCKNVSKMNCRKIHKFLQCALCKMLQVFDS